MKITMKKYVVVVLLSIFLVQQNNAQIGEGKEVEKPLLVGKATKTPFGTSLEYYPRSDGRNYYVLTFKNLEYQKIDDIKSMFFYATDDELEYLFNYFIESLKDKETRTIDVGDQTLYLKKTAMSIRVTVTYNKDPEPDGWFWLSKKQIERLFGKR